MLHYYALLGFVLLFLRNASDEERSPSHIKRWTFDMNSRNDTFGEEVISRANGVLARMDDRYLSLPYRYGYVGHNDAERPYDTAAGGNRAGRVTNCYKRFDLQNTGAPESTFFVGNVQSLQECGFVPRKGSTAEGDGYIRRSRSATAARTVPASSSRPCIRQICSSLPRRGL